MGLGKLEEGIVQSRNVLHATKVNGGSCTTACQTAARWINENILPGTLGGSFSSSFIKSWCICHHEDTLVTSRCPKSELGRCYPWHIASTAKSSSAAKRHEQTDGQKGEILQKSKSARGRNSLVLTYRLQSLWFVCCLLKLLALEVGKGEGWREFVRSPGWCAEFNGQLAPTGP